MLSLPPLIRATNFLPEGAGPTFFEPLLAFDVAPRVVLFDVDDDEPVSD
jgi:hypothetical protein